MCQKGINVFKSSLCSVLVTGRRSCQSRRRGGGVLLVPVMSVWGSDCIPVLCLDFITSLVYSRAPVEELVEVCSETGR